MILTCPSCATSYFAPDEAIGPNGRKVRCQSCAHVWRASTDEPLELTAAAVEAETASFGRREEPPESLAETPAPELPRAFRARAEQQRRIRRAATHGVVWAGLASVFIALIGGAWLFRVEVVDLYPRAAAAYAMIGSPVNPVGLQFEAVGARASPHDPGKVLVSGALRNVRDREIVAPAVRLALLDAHGAEVGHAVVRIDAAPVLPGGVQGFAALIADPGAKAAGVGVDFVMEAKAPAAPAKANADKGDHTAAEPGAEPAHDAPHAPRRPPAAPEGGLRPALAADHGAPIDATPVDAHPAPAAPTALDSSHGEAVTASHHG